ncbi:unnamed protein product [Pleuronectes platessa]|uniref:Uncharacterized protein n=1 Tax=Pleuronectes platessa TaxID=8262 RepID=A0A9N7U6N9_PLEPL|nr:unnamed protein product [Pleuronectes platessa]
MNKLVRRCVSAPSHAHKGEGGGVKSRSAPPETPVTSAVLTHTHSTRGRREDEHRSGTRVIRLTSPRSRLSTRRVPGDLVKVKLSVEARGGRISLHAAGAASTAR